MPRMWWFGLLFVTALLFSFTGFLDADTDTDVDSNVEEDTNSELPNTDDAEKTVKLYPPKFAKPVSIHENFEGLKHIPAEIPEPVLTFSEKEAEPEELPQDDFHVQSQGEAVEHMRQDAEDFERNPKETVETIANVVRDVEEPIENEEDVVAGELEEEDFGQKADDSLGKETADDSLEKETADDNMRKEAISNVEMLRRSDRSAAEGEHNAKPKKRVYVKAIPPEDELYKIYEVHEDDEPELVKHEVVFLDTDSHAHVVHKSKDHPKLSIEHDDFRHDEM